MVSDEFRADRAKFNGVDRLPQVDRVKMRAKLSSTLSELETQLRSTEASLDPSAPPASLMGHSTVQYIDVCVYFLLDWLQTSLKSVPDLLPEPDTHVRSPPYPYLLTYLAQMRQYLADCRGPLPKRPRLSSKDAAARIVHAGTSAVQALQSASSPSDEPFQGKHLRVGDYVAVTPTDTGRVVSARWQDRPH